MSIEIFPIRVKPERIRTLADISLSLLGVNRGGIQIFLHRYNEDLIKEGVIKQIPRIRDEVDDASYASWDMWLDTEVMDHIRNYFKIHEDDDLPTNDEIINHVIDLISVDKFEIRFRDADLNNTYKPEKGNKPFKKIGMSTVRVVCTSEEKSRYEEKVKEVAPGIRPTRYFQQVLNDYIQYLLTIRGDKEFASLPPHHTDLKFPFFTSSIARNRKDYLEMIALKNHTTITSICYSALVWFLNK